MAKAADVRKLMASGLTRAQAVRAADSIEGEEHDRRVIRKGRKDNGKGTEAGSSAGSSSEG